MPAGIGTKSAGAAPSAEGASEAVAKAPTIIDFEGVDAEPVEQAEPTAATAALAYEDENGAPSAGKEKRSRRTWRSPGEISTPASSSSTWSGRAKVKTEMKAGYTEDDTDGYPGMHCWWRCQRIIIEAVALNQRAEPLSAPHQFTIIPLPVTGYFHTPRTPCASARMMRDPS